MYALFLCTSLLSLDIYNIEIASVIFMLYGNIEFFIVLYVMKSEG